MQLIYRPDNGEILGIHIFGLHAADLIHEASNAIALGTRIQVIFPTAACATLTNKFSHKNIPIKVYLVTNNILWYNAGHKICGSCSSNFV